MPGVLMLIIGCFVGLKFADFDQSFRWLPLLDHRSLLTHSVLLPFLAFVCLHRSRHVPSRLFVMGLSLGMAVHLCFDATGPWRGYSLIHVPIVGRISPAASVLWVYPNIVACLYLACRTVWRMSDLVSAIGSIIVLYGFTAAHEGGRSFWALIILGAMTLIAFLIPQPSSKDDDAPFDVRRLRGLEKKL